MVKKIRTRNAPSPTGYAHLGTIYQSMIDRAFAKRYDGSFILRIEDTDQKRYVKGAEDAIYEALDWFRLIPNESPRHGGNFGPYKQSERLKIYQKYAKELIKKGHAYYCFCSRERLQKIRERQQKDGKQSMYDRKCRNLDSRDVKRRLDANEKAVIRMKIPDNQKIIVNDLIRGNIEFDSTTIDDQVILKVDGFPTYHLAVVVDDHLMEISHVVRGPEWITSFPKHKLLYDYFGWDMPVFVHTPMITNMDGSKLSKRQGHSGVDWYRRRGFLPEAVLNFIALLGWSHPKEKEIFDWDEYVKVFDLEDLSPVSPKFDLTKLDWMNGQYLQNLFDDEFIKRFLEWLKYCESSEYKGATEYETHWAKEDYKLLEDFVSNLEPDKRLKFAEINKERVKKFEDFFPLNAFFVKEIEVDETLLTKYKSKDEIIEHLTWVKGLLEQSDWSLESLKEIEEQIKNRAGELGWKVLDVFYPIRVKLTGSKVSPPLFESMWIMGKSKVMKRLNLTVV